MDFTGGRINELWLQTMFYCLVPLQIQVLNYTSTAVQSDTIPLLESFTLSFWFLPNQRLKREATDQQHVSVDTLELLFELQSADNRTLLVAYNSTQLTVIADNKIYDGKDLACQPVLNVLQYVSFSLQISCWCY